MGTAPLTGQGEARDLYLEGLKRLRRGVLLVIIGNIVGVVAAALISTLLIAIFTPVAFRASFAVVHEEIVIHPSPPTPPRVERPVERLLEELLKAPHVLALGVVAIVLIISSLIINLVGLWGNFVPGVRALARARVEFGTASTLIWIGYLIGYLLYLVILILGLVAVTYLALTGSLVGAMMALMGLFIGLLIAGILMLIGVIGHLILLFNLYDIEKNTLYLVAAILMIISLVGMFASLIPLVGGLIAIVISILSFISLILQYVALGESIRRAQTTPTTTPQPTAL
ncbi:MAG: DUF973 family protein [Desulfurococcaceae archaeon]|nr:DUF973 family protein [Desulfurococcaceae archaeon]